MRSITRITELKSKEFVKVSEDVTGSDVYYFTLSESKGSKYPASEGWDKVTYFTNRKVRLKINPSVGKQFVYVLSNPSMPELLKIGYTAKAIDKRISQLNSSTSVAEGFHCEWMFPCYNAVQLEGEVHKYLDSFRVNRGREFFRITLEEARDVIERLGKKYTA